MFNNKKGAFWFIPLIVIGIIMASMVIISYINEAEKKPIPICEGGNCTSPPPNPEPVTKICAGEGNLYCDYGKELINGGTDMVNACNSIAKRFGGINAYFIMGGSSCISCRDYYSSKGILPDTISLQWYTSRAACIEDIGYGQNSCLIINKTEDCVKVKENKCFVVDGYEKYCNINPDDQNTNPCPDIKIAGILPFPDLWCKLQVALTEFFMPFRIVLSVIAAIISWLFTAWIIEARKIIKGKKANLTINMIGIVVGIGVGVLLWFYWLWGLAAVLTVVLLKMFIWKK